jgi:predicted phosphohydrolase
MKIQYCSDLHLEFPLNKDFIEINPLIPVGDILILAGDIVPFENMDLAKDFFRFCSDSFKETYWIAGNHEYYYGTLDGRVSAFKEEIMKNVFLVNNYTIERENLRIIFSTLWTKISPEMSFFVKKGLNDYRIIRDGNLFFTVDRCNYLFDENISYIRKAVEIDDKKKNIVVTHHVPTYQNYPQEYLNSSINEAFATDLDDFIESANIHSWIFGHHHRNIPPFIIGGTNLLTNQLGYVKYAENKGFRADAVIEI